MLPIWRVSVHRVVRAVWCGRSVRDHLAVDRGVVVLDLDDTLTDWWTAIGRAAVGVADDEVAEVLRDVVRREAWIRREDGAVHREHWRLRVEPLTFWRSVFPDSEERASDLAARFAEGLRVQLYEDVLPTP